MKSDGPGLIVEQDPLEGGRGWIWVGVILLAISIAGFVWTSGYTALELHDSILQPISAFALLAGIASSVFGVWLWLRFRKFGHSFLETDMPVAGAPWKGLIRTTSDLSTKGNYTFTLTYEEEHYSSASRSTKTEIIWKATREADYRSVRSSAGIPFEFAPPGKELKKSKSGGMWWLKISAPMRGVNFITLFNVTFLLDAPPKDKNMPWWGQMLTDLTR